LVQVSVMRVDWSKWRGLGVTGKISPRFAHLCREAGTAAGPNDPVPGTALERILAVDPKDKKLRLQTVLGDKLARILGIAPDRLLVDPGFGFGKTVEHNLSLLRHLAELAPDDLPLLVGLSRKSMLGTLTGRPAGERVAGSVALAVIAALKGARVIRAHDVAATVDGLKLVAAVQGSEPPH